MKIKGTIKKKKPVIGMFIFVTFKHFIVPNLIAMEGISSSIQPSTTLCEDYSSEIILILTFWHNCSIMSFVKVFHL